MLASLSEKDIRKAVVKKVVSAGAMSFVVISTSDGVFDMLPTEVPEIINGRTMIPLRFVAESLEWQVGWAPDTKTITILFPSY